MGWLKRHPILSAIIAIAGYVIGTFPQWLGEVWPLFTNKTIPEWISAREWSGMSPYLSATLLIVSTISILGLLIAILLAVRKHRREEKEYKSLQDINAESQKELATAKDKLAAIEDIRPLLKIEPFSIQRKPGHREYSGPHSLKDRIGEFALLRVTNEPISLNSDAIAYRIYAKVSYCDEQWKELFPSVDGAWFPLFQSHRSFTIGPPNNKPDNLNPHESAYLGIGLRYERHESSLYALSASSGNFPNWFHLDLALSRETTYIKVVIGCHDFQATYCYVLKNHSSKEKLQLEPTEKPNVLG